MRPTSLERTEHWYAQQLTVQEPDANRAFAVDWDNLRAAFDWALATHRGRDVADLLHTTFWFAVHTVRWEHRQWAIAARAAGADTGRIASAAVVLWASLAAESDTVTEALAALDPATPDLAARDVEQIWLARAATAFMTNDHDEIERANAWLDERSPRCGNSITEAWILANILTATLAAPDPAVVARMQRLGQTSQSPSAQAIAGFVVHGYRYVNPKLGEGLDLGDIADGVQHAIACSRAAGNVIVETNCMNTTVIPLTDRGERRDAAVLRATLWRTHEIRWDFALTFLVARVAVWLARVGQPEAASVLDGYFRAHVNTAYPALQPTLEQLDQLLDPSTFPTARAGGATMTPTEVIDFLDHELVALADEDTTATSQPPQSQAGR